MKKIVRNTFFAFLAAAAMFSCAKQESVSYTDMEQASLDTWIATYIEGATRHSNGLYTKVLHAVDHEGLSQPKAGDWVEILFTGWSMPDSLLKLPGNCFVTRDSTLAAMEGSTGLYLTHYAPKKCYMSTLPGILTEAMFQTLLMMRPGEKWAFYAPSSLMYGSSGTNELYSYGYQGSSVLPGSIPSYMEIELVRVVTDVEADETAQVETYAAAHLGKQPKDSTLVDFYLNTYPQDVAADSVRKDTIAHIYYIKRFLDGTVYETNIDSVAQRVYGAAPATYSPLSYRPDSNSEIDAFYQAVTRMKYNSWAKFVFSSKYGYFYSGLTPSNYGAEIDPYTPLYFEIYIPAWADIQPPPKDEDEE